MSEHKVYVQLRKHPHTAYSVKSLEKIYLQDCPYIARKLKQLKKRKMINCTILKINQRTEDNILFKNNKPKLNSNVPFWHLKDQMEVEAYVY